jgi:uncharacterized damage-inducible protein DinB
MRFAASDVSPAHAAYIELVPEDDVMAALQQQSSETQKMLASLDEERAAYRYAEGKWSIKELVGHVADSERILGYRALAIARGETQPLPGFDEGEYVRHAAFDAWKLGDLAEEYALVRRANIVFFQNLPEEAWDRRGTANNHPVTVRALAYTIVGHERHHLKVLRERYAV